MSSFDDEGGCGLSEVDDLLLKAIIEDDPLKTLREVAQGERVDYSTVVHYLKKIGKVKTLIKEVLERTGRNALKTATSSPEISEQEEPYSPTRQCPATHSEVTLLKLNELGYETLPHAPYL
ncbi:hypothetical protein RB195_000994 [Necator americanus]|uniref:Uncharacterized protein n=1 Tax=Necator americanus TaxID=51031 RepID=A0ABR1DCD2_NECAM